MQNAELWVSGKTLGESPLLTRGTGAISIRRRSYKNTMSQAPRTKCSTPPARMDFFGASPEAVN